MKTIFKYQISPWSTSRTMPALAEILTVQVQGEDVCVWARVDTDFAPKTRQFGFYGTGHPLPEDPGVYVGTVQLGPLVWHVFDRGEE